MNRCVLGAVSDAAGVDAATDASGPDAASDAASVDAAARDTGFDAFMSDAFRVDAAAPVDAGSDAGNDVGMLGSTGCTAELASALLCDGFESDPGPWTGRNETGGTVMADGLEAQRGNRSLHARSTVTGGQANREAAGLGPFNSGDLWIRVSVFVPSTATPFDFTWFAIGEVMAPYHGISLGMGVSGTAGSYSTISSTYVSGSSLVVPRDVWTCLELHILVSDTVGVIEIYRNGALGASMAGLDTHPTAGFTRLGVGIDYADPAQGPLDTWLDEVALSRARLPCP